jgi:hypothetical protein
MTASRVENTSSEIGSVVAVAPEGSELAGMTPTS